MASAQLFGSAALARALGGPAAKAAPRKPTKCPSYGACASTLADAVVACAMPELE